MVLPDNALAVLVGEQPEAEDIRAGTLLGGQVGQALLEQLRRHGIDTSRLAKISAIACPAYGPRTERRGKLAVKSCRGWFLEQFARVPEHLPMLVLGRWAASAVVGKSKHRGFIREL